MLARIKGITSVLGEEQAQFNHIHPRPSPEEKPLWSSDQVV